MLATSVRVRPCSDLLSRSSSGRVTSSSPLSARATLIGSLMTCCKEPLGPFTETAWPSTVTSTPAGTGTGSLPMRDMSATSLVSRRSPHVGEHFAAYAGAVRLLVGQQALRCGDDRDTQATEHLRQSSRPRVHPQPRLRDPSDTRDRALPVLAVLQRDRQGLADLALRRIVDRIPRDVALACQDLRDSHLDLAVWHGRGLVVRLAGVPHPGQHVRNRIRHCHAATSSSMWFPAPFGPDLHRLDLFGFRAARHPEAERPDRWGCSLLGVGRRGADGPGPRPNLARPGGCPKPHLEQRTSPTPPTSSTS